MSLFYFYCYFTVAITSMSFKQWLHGQKYVDSWTFHPCETPALMCDLSGPTVSVSVHPKHAGWAWAISLRTWLCNTDGENGLAQRVASKLEEHLCLCRCILKYQDFPQTANEGPSPNHKKPQSGMGFSKLHSIFLYFLTLNRPTIIFTEKIISRLITDDNNHQIQLRTSLQLHINTPIMFHHLIFLQPEGV